MPLLLSYNAHRGRRSGWVDGTTKHQSATQEEAVCSPFATDSQCWCLVTLITVVP